jgi:hypothetical protein
LDVVCIITFYYRQLGRTWLLSQQKVKILSQGNSFFHTMDCFQLYFQLFWLNENWQVFFSRELEFRFYEPFSIGMMGGYGIGGSRKIKNDIKGMEIGDTECKIDHREKN